MSKHTPGPWCYDLTDQSIRPLGASGPCNPRLALLLTLKDRNRITEHHANARLIAKAPEIAEKLEEAAAVLDILANDLSDAGNSEQAEMATERAIHYRALLREIEE